MDPMKKRKANPISEEDAKALIPGYAYCHDDYLEPCPFLTHRRMSKRKWATFVRTHIIPDSTITRKHAEYCRYLKAFLGIQDMVKDCDVNLADPHEDERPKIDLKELEKR